MRLKSEMAAPEDDFIDIEVTSPPKSREFEFQMSSNSVEKGSTTSPADELFYKGKLLPLHLPPRMQMFQKLLLTTEETCEEDGIRVPFFISSTAPSTNGCCTPVESCNISPAESCRVSCELNPSEYFFNWSTDEFRSFIHTHPKKSWSQKLKFMKRSSFLSQKLLTTRAYLKSLFMKSVGKSRKAGEGQDGNLIRLEKKNPFVTSSHEEVPRRSFSGAIKRHSPSKCLSSSSSSDSSSSGASSLSSSFSVNSSVLPDLHLMKRSSGDPLEIETSIEAAIAHCKSSQKPFITL